MPQGNQGHPQQFRQNNQQVMHQGMQQVGMPQGMPQGMPPAQQAEAGLPPQDLINSLYDIFGSYPRKNVLPYAYQFNLTGNNQVAADGTGRASIKVSSDAAFNSVYITGTASGAYTLFMRTDSSDRQLSNEPIHSATAVGTAERPFIWPKPLLLAPNTTISFDIQDLSGNVNDIYLTLWGFKVYRRQYAMAG